MSKASPKSISQKQLIDALKHSSANSFAFLVGSGASVTSGIPAGGTLARKWLKKLQDILSEEEFAAWNKSVDSKNTINDENAPTYYGDIYNKRFEACEQNGYDEIVSLMDEAKPSLGYLFFAQVINKLEQRHIITTNFDHLIEDSLFFATTTRPLVVGHESLASHISITTNRPSIMKVHRDMFFTPFSTEEDTSRMKQEWIAALSPILNHCNLVVLGYGGNDGSVMEFLKDIKPRKPIYWCSRGDANKLDSRISKLLTANDYTVQYEGFDELMYALHSSCELQDLIHSDDEGKVALVKLAENRVKDYQKRFKTLETDAIENSKQGVKVSSSIEKMFDKDTQALFHAYEGKTDDEKEKRFKQGLDAFPNSADIHGYYATFLKNIRKDYDQAESYYQKALKLDPDHANINGNYALFLKNIRKNYDQAESYYEKALKLAPEDEDFYGNYANFLSDIRKDYDQAENYYQKSLKLAPEDADLNGNYAKSLLAQVRLEEGEKYLEKAFTLNPESGLEAELWFYAWVHFPKKYKQAQAELNRLIEAGAKSEGWSFEGNIEVAKKNKHPDLTLLKEYAEKISGVPH